MTPHHYRETVTRGKISVTNNAFSFSARHPVLQVAMMHLKEKYDPSCWNCIGPKLITAAVRKHSGARLVQKIPAWAQVEFVPLHRSAVSQLVCQHSVVVQDDVRQVNPGGEGHVP